MSLTRSTHLPRLALVALLAIALALTLGPGMAGAKKKKGGGAKAVNITKPVNAPIPIATTTSLGLLTSTIDVGKQFKGQRVRDVNVTLQTTGIGTNSIASLIAKLTAPNGATSAIIFGGMGPGNLLGPLTLDDEAILGLGAATVPNDPTLLYAPYQGTAQATGPVAFPLAVFDDGPVQGTWTLRWIDTSTAAGHSNTFVSWRLNVAAGRPFLTK